MARRTVKEEAKVVADMFARPGQTRAESLLEMLKLSGASRKQIAQAERMVEAARLAGNPATRPVR